MKLDAKENSFQIRKKEKKPSVSLFINLKEPLIQACLPALLKDKTTHKNIVFATDSYQVFGESFKANREITRNCLGKMDLRPRVLKSLDEQSQRTRQKAEVFTPSWLCCKMNNHCDEEWFGRPDVFNHLEGESWKAKGGRIGFPAGKTWKDYVDSRRLEITCGEAPYIVSRYDASTGASIPIRKRIGLLDRKLRVVNENAADRAEWLKWTLRAFQSVYGYEWQGDSLLIARINLLMTFIEYHEGRWGAIPADDAFLKTASDIVNVIAWNFWQMDGLTGTVPYTALSEESDISGQPGLFGEDTKGFELQAADEEDDRIQCRIFDWRSKYSMTYSSLRKGEK